MIDPKELRLGNLVKTNKGILIQANGIRHDWEAMDYIIIDKNDIGYSIDELSPIHITPEWLERLGFETVANYYDLDFNGGGLRFLSDLDECRLFTGSEYSLTVAMDYDTCEIPNAPKYIHQLQNLYHALTGQELTVKDLTPTL